MITTYNEIFKQLLTEYNLPDDLSFSVDLPTEVQEILNDKISITDLGVTLKSYGRLHKATQAWENQSIIENSENHKPSGCEKTSLLNHLAHFPTISFDAV